MRFGSTAPAIIALFGAAVLAFRAEPAQANSCSVQVLPIAFSDVDMVTGQSQAVGRVEVFCTFPTIPYSVQLDGGLNASNRARRVRNITTGKRIPYYIYEDPQFSSEWDMFESRSYTGSNLIVLYGEIPYVAPSKPAGSYGDTVTVTVSF